MGFACASRLHQMATELLQAPLAYYSNQQQAACLVEVKHILLKQGKPRCIGPPLAEAGRRAMGEKAPVEGCGLGKVYRGQVCSCARRVGSDFARLVKCRLLEVLGDDDPQRDEQDRDACDEEEDVLEVPLVDVVGRPHVRGGRDATLRERAERGGQQVDALADRAQVGWQCVVEELVG